MLEFLRKKQPTQLNNGTPDRAQQELRRIRRRIGMQTGLALMIVALTVLIVFGMTAAWYTNVVQSSSLIFEVEKMGVNVNATVGVADFTAQPGDVGLITLEATNNGTRPVDITVSINKANMDEQMQRRLYFFVEAQSKVNGEIAQRSYVTAAQGYTYTLFGGNSLTLTESYHNAAALKWCWVYDVLGYYVLGQAQENDVLVQEYLRPIEYDYDSATFDETGNLLTVDGSTTVDAFLAVLSATDGYAGQISAERMTGRYYQVDVDASGYGVYAYLCTYQEVEANTDYDTALGAAALEGSPASCTALLTVNAENAEMQSVSVDSADALLTALTSGQTQALTLSTDVTLETAVTIPANSDILLDLNGHSLVTNTAGFAFTLEPDASLIMTNGALNGSSAGDAFSITGADLTLNDVDISGYAKGLHVMDYNGAGQDSNIHMTNCTMDTTGYGILLYGNGSASEQTTKLIIEDSELTSDNYVISGNGSLYGTGRWGTEIEIINSKLIQDVASGVVSAAIYHPQKYGTLNIYGSQVSGYTGMALKGGTITITQSTVTGMGTDPAAPKLATSGFTDTADGIYVETGYGYDIMLTLRDSSAISYFSLGCRIFEAESPCVTFIEEGNTYTDKSGPPAEQ